MARTHVKWNIVFLGFGMLALGIITVIFFDTWGNRSNIINPIGVMLIIGSIFMTCWGFRIRLPEG